MKSLFLKSCFSLLAATSAVTSFAALPDPVDPRAVAQMSMEERLEQSRQLRDAMAKATPEERKAYREKLRAKMDTLSPE